MADESVQRELNNQLQGIDPFAVARNKAQAQGQLPPAQMTTPQGFEMPAAQSASPVSSNQPLVKLMANQDMSLKDMDSQIQGMLKSLNLDTSKINFTSIGKQNLLNVLQKQYGDKYDKHPKVKPLLDLFNQRMSTFSKDSAQQEVVMMNQANRTLEYLKGMK